MPATYTALLHLPANGRQFTAAGFARGWGIHTTQGSDSLLLCTAVTLPVARLPPDITIIHHHKKQGSGALSSKRKDRALSGFTWWTVVTHITDCECGSRREWWRLLSRPTCLVKTTTREPFCSVNGRVRLWRCAHLQNSSERETSLGKKYPLAAAFVSESTAVQCVFWDANHCLIDIRSDVAVLDRTASVPLVSEDAAEVPWGTSHKLCPLVRTYLFLFLLYRGTRQWLLRYPAWAQHGAECRCKTTIAPGGCRVSVPTVYRQSDKAADGVTCFDYRHFCRELWYVQSRNLTTTAFPHVRNGILHWTWVLHTAQSQL